LVHAAGEFRREAMERTTWRGTWRCLEDCFIFWVKEHETLGLPLWFSHDGAAEESQLLLDAHNIVTSTYKKQPLEGELWEDSHIFLHPRTVMAPRAACRAATAHQCFEFYPWLGTETRRVPSHGTGRARVREEQVRDFGRAKGEGKGAQGVHGDR
jgi:hypothetical protein